METGRADSPGPEGVGLDTPAQPAASPLRLPRRTATTFPFTPHPKEGELLEPHSSYLCGPGPPRPFGPVVWSQRPKGTYMVKDSCRPSKTNPLTLQWSPHHGHRQGCVYLVTLGTTLRATFLPSNTALPPRAQSKTLEWVRPRVAEFWLCRFLPVRHWARHSAALGRNPRLQQHLSYSSPFHGFCCRSELEKASKQRQLPSSRKPS